MQPKEKTFRDSINELIDWTELPELQEIIHNNYPSVTNKEIYQTLYAAYFLQYEHINQLAKTVKNLTEEIQKLRSEVKGFIKKN